MTTRATPHTNSLLAYLLATISLCTGAYGSVARVDAVFFAQTHVQQPDHPYFKLVANRDTLLKVHVLAPDSPPAPQVSAQLSLDGAATNLILRGPATLPSAVSIEPGIIEHRFDNAFTAMIPKAWIKSGLTLTVTAGEATQTFNDLKIGAPTVVNMTMFDVHYFAYTNADHEAGWKDAIEAKWPVSELVVDRVPKIVFEEIVVPPRAGQPATRCSSPEDYLQKTGIPFDGEQATALRWKGALQHAGGQTRRRLFLINIYNVDAGGQAGGFSGVSSGTRTGVLHHELGHALSLPHWQGARQYPYRDAMHGIECPGPHVGPTWGFDARIGLPGAPEGMPRFISPIVQEGAKQGKVGEWKHDPMQGGMQDQDPGLILRMFSDYSTHCMQGYLEGHVVLWDEASKQFVSWDDSTKSYSNVVQGNGLNLPVEPNVNVISVLASVSALTPEANLIYPPIGPYTSGLIQRFDPSLAEDREAAQKVYGTCDLSFRITQGGKTKTYLLPVGWDPTQDPQQPWNFGATAINLPARDGAVTKAELLLTPAAHKNGLPENPTILDTWERK